MKDRHIELPDLEEEKTPNHFKKSVAVPVSLMKPTAEVEDVDFETEIHIPSYLLCFAVLFVLLGLTLIIFALASNKHITIFLGIPLWGVGAFMIAVGLIGVYFILSRMQKDSNEEQRKIVSALQDQAEWSRSLA
mmetsp:Transcript_13430/g.25290  ORF Transcript_13430/g.25290 Transcript_13430/m.25290 type:complete len:134 (-) Transcript_13430:21-422(-)